MKIRIVYPPARAAAHGNRTTAERWAALLGELGHGVEVSTEYAPGADLLVAIHAAKSAAAVAQAAAEGVRSVVLLAGTDVYGDLAGSAASLARAWRVVVLQERALEVLPPEVRAKAVVIHQSARRAPAPVVVAPDRFVAMVIAHLREVKDPMRAAEASRLVPPSSRLLVVHAGAALDPSHGARAAEEARTNPRYRWLGDRPHDEVLAMLAGAQVLVLTSRAEGGANAISEALAAEVPVIASRIDGSLGLLGEAYPGYFAPGDTEALAALLTRAETDPSFHAALRAACAKRRPLADPASEREAWSRLLTPRAAGARAPAR